MTRCVDDEQTRGLKLHLALGVHDRSLRLDCFGREVSCTNLLSDTSGFSLLDIGLTDLVQKFRFTGIDVSENTADRRAKIVLGGSCLGFLKLSLSPLGRFCFPPSLLSLGRCKFLVLRIIRIIVTVFGVFILVLVLVFRRGFLALIVCTVLCPTLVRTEQLADLWALLTC